MRLREAREQNVSWKKWGPYLSERQWGTVREDYSDSGDAWKFFTHDQARSRAYRWGEDGLAGISDDEQHLCFALALWNGKDPILKERLFGVTNSEGNHGEVMRGELDPAVEALSADVRKILGLDPHGKDFSVVYGAVSRNDKEIAILTRSILEVIIDLPAVIQVPAAHVEEKRVSPTYVEEAVKSGKIPPLIRIQSSSEKHKGAFVSIQYRDTYFWIDDRDLRSKKLFSFLIFIFTLVETEEKGTAPIVTVPTNECLSIKSLFCYAGLDPASRRRPDEPRIASGAGVGNHLNNRVPVFTGNPGCARSLRLTPPPSGRPAGVYPVLDTGPE